MSPTLWKSWPAALCLLAMVSTVPHTHARPRSVVCHAISESQIAGLFDQWQAALQTGRSSEVLARYATKSTLVPSEGSKPLRKRKDKLRYLDALLARHPSAQVDKRRITLECDRAIDAGVYTVRFADGTAVTTHYRFDYEWSGKAWQITRHQSSALPARP